MRDIKFRAWDTQNERMVAGPYRFVPMNETERTFYEKEGDFIYYEDWRDEDDGISRPCFIMQFTGWKDKDEVHLYEGDRIEIFWSKEPHDSTFEVVSYDTTYAYFKYGNNPLCELIDPIKEFKIVGNIYEESNPELLK